GTGRGEHGPQREDGEHQDGDREAATVRCRGFRIHVDLTHSPVPPRYEEYGGGRRRRGPAFPAEGPQAGPWRLHEAPGAVRMGSRAGYGSPSSGGSRTWTSRWPVRWGTSPGGSTCSTSGTSTSCAPPAPGVSTSSSA